MKIYIKVVANWIRVLLHIFINTSLCHALRSKENYFLQQFELFFFFGQQTHCEDIFRKSKNFSLILKYDDVATFHHWNFAHNPFEKGLKLLFFGINIQITPVLFSFFDLNLQDLFTFAPKNLESGNFVNPVRKLVSKYAICWEAFLHF